MKGSLPVGPLGLSALEKELLKALKALVAAGNTVSPLSGDYGRASVKAVRIAGKFMAAMENAEKVIAKSQRRPLDLKARADKSFLKHVRKNTDGHFGG